MDAVFNEIAGVTSRDWVQLTNWHFYAFLLIVIRMGGLLTTAPLFSQTVVPVNIRAMIAIGLGFVLLPVVVQTSGQQMAAFDRDGNGLLYMEELPEHMHGRLRHVADELNQDVKGGIPIESFKSRSEIPIEFSGLLGDILCEFSLGFLLGLGVTVLMSGLQLAGQIIDQQIGLEFASIVNPDLQGGASISGQMLFLLGGVALLVMEPVNGHVLMLQALVETFDAMPVGEAVLFSGTAEFFTGLIQKSLLIGVQVAAPVLATMSLVSLAMGFLGHSVPQINQLVVGFPIRSLAGILILSMSLTGAGRILVDSVPDVISELRIALTSWE